MAEGAAPVVVRLWHGRVSRAKAPAYRKFLLARAIPDYRAIPGNVSAQILERNDGEVTHFVTLTVWTSREAICAFTGEDIERAKYYPEDLEFLLEQEPHVVHYDVVDQA